MLSLALVGAGAVFMQTLQAQIFTHFELDRNTVDAAAAGEDWNTIYAAETNEEISRLRQTISIS